MRLFIAVTHLHGSGHLIRSLLIAEEFVSQGHDVTLVSGGFPLSHIKIDPRIDFVQLPPVRSNGTDFSKLLTEDGEATPDYLAARNAEVCRALDQASPDCVITEQYPFGRGSLRSEYQALIERAVSRDNPPLLLASVRDVLEPPSKPAKEERAHSALDHYFDGVLVHGDPDFMPLQMSWPGADKISVPLHYTGYIAPEMKPIAESLQADEEGNVLISGGGGPLGASLFNAAMDAALGGAYSQKTWRFLVGGAARHETIFELKARAEDRDNIVIEAVRPDFFSLYAEAYCALVRVGYNAFLDLCRTRMPTVLCPFDEGNEREQTIRAKAVSQRLGLPCLSGDDLGGKNLMDAIAEAVKAPTISDNLVAMDGQKRTVEIVTDLLAQKGSKG